MVSVGGKALSSKRHKACSTVEDSLMGEDKSYKQSQRKKGMSRKAKKEGFGFDGDRSKKGVSSRGTDGTGRPTKPFKNQSISEPQTSLVRKQVDPETAKYFSEIANLFESEGVDSEERSVICGNALEETRGKELELATDYIISHTLQILLEGCNVDHLCGFLRSSAKVFPFIATDRSGSHVAETALKSLSMHLDDREAFSVIEETLTIICKVLVVNPVDLMCNCYGSHVLRSLLCLCKGAPLDSSEFHAMKSSTILAERLNLKAPRSDENVSPHLHQGFPDLLKFLVYGMLKCSKKDIKTMQVHQYSSLVLQTALKLLAGHDDDLLQIIPILLGCNKENIKEANFIELIVAKDIVDLVKETAYSHLMEVVLEVAPESLYNEMFTKVFRNSLFELTSHPCGNFVVQALASHARSQNQMVLIWEELGPKFKDLLEMGRSGVIASLIAASQRLRTHEHKCSEALAAAVCSANESPRYIVPRILFLESYFSCVDRSSWQWESGVKIHVMGSLILQAVFRYQSELIQPYVTSITSMEAAHVLEAAKDSGGARVIEAFLGSNASAKHKRRLIMKLQGHFGELSLNMSGSFTVEKCYSSSNVSLKEAIVSELLAVRNELSRTKQGPHLLRKLDVDGFAAQPDQWRSKQTSKQSTYKEFYAAFGSTETKSYKNDYFLADPSKRTSHPKDLKKMREEIDLQMTSAPHSMGLSGTKRHPEKAEKGSEKVAKYDVDDDISRGKSKKFKKTNHGGSENAAVLSKTSDLIGSKRASLPDNKIEKKQHRNDSPLKASKKKLKP